MKSAVMAVVSIACLLSILSCQGKKYPAGRDTFDSFGDGRFQILRRTVHVLFDSKAGVAVASPVQDYSTESDTVHILVRGGSYGVLNLANGAYRSYKNREQAPQQSRNKLSALGSKSTSVVKEISFGDGRFQVRDVQELALHDCETQTTLQNNVQDYSMSGHYVYLRGRDGTYGVLNVAAGKYHHYQTMDDAPSDFKKHLSRLGKSWFIKFKER